MLCHSTTSDPRLFFRSSLIGATLTTSDSLRIQYWKRLRHSVGGNGPHIERMHISPWVMFPRRYFASSKPYHAVPSHQLERLTSSCHLIFTLPPCCLPRLQKTGWAALSTWTTVLAYNREYPFCPEGSAMDCIRRYVRDIWYV